MLAGGVPSRIVPETPQSVLAWLLDGDPSIRWQVLRDLTDEPADAVAAERARVATEGWGARLLDRLTADAPLGEDDPTRWAETPEGEATNLLLLLRAMGLEPNGDEARTAVARVRDTVVWAEWDAAPFFQGEVEPCINGMVLAVGAYFGEASERLLDRLLGEQLADGGWNCEAPSSDRGSFHTTICVLEGLSAYERTYGATAAVSDARTRGEAYLLDRGLLRSRSTGTVIDDEWTLLAFPTGWHYDVLRGLEYLRAAGVAADPRCTEALGLVAEHRLADGRWPLHHAHGGAALYDVGERPGAPSRWNTLRAARVLEWAEGDARTAT